MVQQGLITINGYVGSEPVSFGKDAPACSFRIGCTRRYFDNSSKEWRDRPTIWITVKAFRLLAQNVLASVHKGDPIIVSGSLASEQWERDGEMHSRTVIEAASVGHDLTLGTSVFTKQKSGFVGSGAQHPAGQNMGAGSNQPGVPQQSLPADPYAQGQNQQMAGNRMQPPAESEPEEEMDDESEYGDANAPREFADAGI